MRFKHQGVWTDGNGRRIDSAVVSAFLAGTDTAASVYADSSGGVAINSVTTDESGLYEFWVDDTDYTQDQLFKIIMAKANFQSKTIKDIEIFKSNRLVLKGDKNSYIDGRTDPRTITLGAVRQEHTAGIPGTRAYHIDIRPNGFDDTSGVVVRHDLEGGSNTIRPKCLNLSVDVTGATNAHFNAIEVAKVGDIGAGMKVDAVDVRQGVGVIDQESGTTGAADTAFKYDDSGASYTDVTTAFGSAGTDVSIFDGDSDYIYIGHATTFTAVEVILATVASKSVKPIFEYSQGASAWNTVSISDDTNGFRENGNIFFEEPGDWATDTVNAIGSKYWFRIQRNNNNVPVVPIEDTIKVASATNYSWDANGDLVVNDITTEVVTSTDIITKGPWVDARAYGAIGDGVADNRSAFDDLNTLGIDFTLTKGTYKVSSNLTLNNRITFSDGAILAPDVGVTITTNGLIIGPTGYGTFIGGAGDIIINDVTVYVPADFATIQEAVDHCPKVLWQRLTIRLSAGTYPEDVLIENIAGARKDRESADAKKARIVIRGDADVPQDPNVRVKSITVINCSGTNGNPTIFRFTIYGDNEYTPGPPAAYASYQGGESEVNDISFDGDGVLYCVNSYSSRVTVINTDFGDSVNQYATVTKHLGSVLMQTGNTGVLTEYAYRAEAGMILCNNASSLRGEKGLVIRMQDTFGIGGVLFDTGSQQVWGANSFGEPLGSTFRTYFESLDGYTKTLVGGGTAQLLSGGLYLQTGTTISDSAQLSMSRTTLIETTNDWELVPRQFGVGLLQNSVADSTWYAVLGDLGSKYIGFKRINAGLYAVAHNGSSETTLLLDVSPGGGLSLYLKVYTPLGGDPYVDFYVGKNFKGQLTSGLPTGSAGDIRFTLKIETDDNVNKQIRLGELMFSKAF